MTIRVDPEWWKTLFDGVYLLTDARSVCDEALTRREVDVICQLIPIASDHRILDLCGGHGRHGLELCERGYRKCTVLDYSLYLLNHGKSCVGDHDQSIDFVRGDARGMGFESGTFEHVLIMGNSLGYIQDPDADRLILAEACRILRSGGWIVVDVTDGTFVRSRFNPSARHEIGPDMVVCRQREINRDAICTREMVISKERGIIRDRTYSIRLYEPESLAALVADSGFASVKVHTDFTPHQGEGDYGFMNQRMIVTAKKP